MGTDCKDGKQCGCIVHSKRTCGGYHLYVQVAGSYILDGTFQRGCKVRISREGTQIFEGDLASLKRFKDDVKEVKAGYECGLIFDGFSEFKELDIVEAYIMVEVPR